jgi:hypothetical protein
MSDERETLAEVMHDAFVAARDLGGWRMIADAILASDWLAQVKAAARAEALRGAAEAIDSGDVDHEELRMGGVDAQAPRGWSDASVIAAHDVGSVWSDWLRYRADAIDGGAK